MKTQMFLKGAMVAIVLFVGAALFAGTSGVKCEGSVVDQYGEGIVGITVTTTSGPSVSATTNSLGRFSMSGIQAGSAVRVIVPAGFSAVGNTESEPLTQAENVVNFTLHDDSCIVGVLLFLAIFLVGKFAPCLSVEQE